MTYSIVRIFNKFKVHQGILSEPVSLPKDHMIIGIVSKKLLNTQLYTSYKFVGNLHLSHLIKCTETNEINLNVTMFSLRAEQNKRTLSWGWAGKRLTCYTYN